MSYPFRDILNVDDFATVNRRSLLAGLGASAVLSTTGALFSRSAWAAPIFRAYPFSLGVASGDCAAALCPRRTTTPSARANALRIRLAILQSIFREPPAVSNQAHRPAICAPTPVP